MHRLNWQRVWLLGPPEEGDTISNVAWRPDSKLIAVTYTKSKLLCLVDIENKNIVHQTKIKSNERYTCINWLSLTPPMCNNCSESEKINSSSTGPYLPPLPTLSRSFGGQETERKEYLSQTLNVLFVSRIC